MDCRCDSGCGPRDFASSRRRRCAFGFGEVLCCTVDERKALAGGRALRHVRRGRPAGQPAASLCARAGGSIEKVTAEGAYIPTLRLSTPSAKYEGRRGLQIKRGGRAPDEPARERLHFCPTLQYSTTRRAARRRTMLHMSNDARRQSSQAAQYNAGACTPQNRWPAGLHRRPAPHRT